MNGFRLLLAALVILVGCGGYRGQSQVLYSIDPTWPAWETQQARLELSYLSASFGLTFTEVPYTDAELHITSFSDAKNPKDGVYTSGADTVRINFERAGETPGQLQHVIGHEVGHWLGLSHNCERCNNLMSVYDRHDQTGIALPDDVRAFRALWPSIPQT